MDGQQKGKRPAALKVLIATMAVFTVVGFVSGFGLFLSPSGKGAGLSLDLLENAPVSDFALVGLFFIAFYGVLPALATYGLMTKRRWRWTDPINRWTGENWAWTASAAVGMILILWIVAEISLIGVLTGIGLALQVGMTLLGIWILAFSMRPSVRSSMKLEDGLAR